MAGVLHHFLYLDDELTRSSLAQLEGGTYEEEEQTLTEAEARSRGLGGRLGPVEGRAGRDRAGEQTTKRTVRQTAEAEFRRLDQLLEEQNLVQWLEAFDDDIWQQLRRSEVVAVESTVSVPKLHTYVDVVSNVGPLAELMEALGEKPDAEMQQMVAAGAVFDKVLTEIPVVARASGTGRYKFICPLKREFLRGELNDLNSEAVVLGTIQRKLKSGEKYSLLDNIGMGGLPREERRKLERDLTKNKDMRDTVVSPPAALLTPLAIYR